MGTKPFRLLLVSLIPTYGLNMSSKAFTQLVGFPRQYLAMVTLYPYRSEDEDERKTTHTLEKTNIIFQYFLRASGGEKTGERIERVEEGITTEYDVRVADQHDRMTSLLNVILSR